MLIVGKQLVKSYEPAWNKASVLSLVPKLAVLSALITRPEIAAFTAKNQPDWSPDAVKQARAYTVEPFLKNLLKYANSKRHYFDSFETTQHLWAEASLGNLKSPQHFFHYDAVEWGFNFTEPQITKGLTHFLNQSKLACWHFMLALTNHGNIEGNKFSVDDDNKNSFLETVTVDAEVQAGKQKRIDILIKWQSAKKECCLAVLECKFGHHITYGQLPNYRKYAKNQASDNHWLFIITQEVDKKSQRFIKNHHNNTWHQVRWGKLLRRWERSLTQDHFIEIHDFSRFRRTLWNKTSN
jgi:hypothetical protein